MDPINDRITTPRLAAMRGESNAERNIASLLHVEEMPLPLAARTRADIAAFVATGDAVLASQLIHAAQVRRNARTTAPGELPRPGQTR